MYFYSLANHTKKRIAVCYPSCARAENEPRARIRGHFSRPIFTPPNPLTGGQLGGARGNSRFLRQAKPPLSKGGLEGLSI